MDLFEEAAQIAHTTYISDIRFLPDIEKDALIKTMEKYKNHPSWDEFVQYVKGVKYDKR